MSVSVGIYVHHHGAGHARRAGVLAQALRRKGAGVTLLGSTAKVDVLLPRDDDPGDSSFLDPTAGGRLHWVPLGHPGLRRRMTRIAEWVEQTRPDVVVVDVSVEVAVHVRLLGVPVVLVAQPGRRDDPAHDLACSVASAIIAPWPPSARPAPHLSQHRQRVHEVGGISALGSAQGRDRGGNAVVLCGAEGFDDEGLPQVVTAALPELSWTVLDGTRWVDDISLLLRQASVVVSHAGQNAVADIAATAAPAIVVPQQRPFDEQDHLAAELGRLGLAVCLTADEVRYVERVPWRRLVQQAQHSAAAWSLWATEGAAARAADVVLAVAAAQDPFRVRA